MLRPNRSNQLLSADRDNHLLLQAHYKPNLFDYTYFYYESRIHCREMRMSASPAKTYRQ